MDDYAIKVYLEDIRKYNLLTREEEKTCTEEELFHSNLRLVVKIAKKYQNQGLDLLDLINEGNTGLLRAVEKFDRNRGIKFNSYGSYWIKQRITRAIDEKGKAIRMSTSRRKDLKKIDRAKCNALNLPYEEQVEKIAQETYLSEKKVKYLLSLLDKEVVSLEDLDEEKSGLYNVIQSNGKSPERKSLENSLKRDINKLSKNLTKREWNILQLRYGLNDKKPHTLEETGKIYGLTRERIRQIQEKALKKLEHKSGHLKNYCELQNH